MKFLNLCLVSRKCWNTENLQTRSTTKPLIARNNKKTKMRKHWIVNVYGCDSFGAGKQNWPQFSLVKGSQPFISGNTIVLDISNSSHHVWTSRFQRCLSNPIPGSLRVTISVIRIHPWNNMAHDPASRRSRSPASECSVLKTLPWTKMPSDSTSSIITSLIFSNLDVSQMFQRSSHYRW